MNEIHIGSLIKQKMREKGMSTIDFAAAIHCSRPNVHSIFQRKSIDVQQLIAISKALEYDFLQIYHATHSSRKCMLLVELDKMQLDKVENVESIRIIKQWDVSE
mgnify:CR=1 FL=1